MTCLACGDPTPQACDDCGRPHCAFCMKHDDAGQWCEECHERQRAESLEAAGGERLMRAIAKYEREARRTP